MRPAKRGDAAAAAVEVFRCFRVASIMLLAQLPVDSRQGHGQGLGAGNDRYVARMVFLQRARKSAR